MFRSKIPDHLIGRRLDPEEVDYYKKRQRPKGEGYLAVAIIAIVLFPFLWLWSKVTNEK